MLREVIRLVVFVALLALPAVAQRVLDVPAHYKSIQAAINAGRDFDTIRVAPGVYRENIRFSGKILVVTSSHGAAVTTIDGGGKGTVVVFAKVDSRLTVLNGFTVTNGLGVSAGGVHCNNGSPTISNNIICRNESRGAGGGISGGPGWTGELILNNVVCHNVVRSVSNSTIFLGLAAGGGIHGGGFRSEIVGNLIYANECHCKHGAFAMAQGGGLYAWYSRMYNNTVFGNRVSALAPIVQARGGGVYTTDAAVLKNCVVWGNQAAADSQIASNSGKPPAVTFSCIQGGYAGTGNTSADPRFVDPVNQDLHLRHDSPCRNQGVPICCIPDRDFEGDPRIVDGKLDIGADEFHPHLYHLGDPVPGGMIQVRFIGTPGRPAFWGFSSHALVPPVAIPGLTGMLHLNPSHLALLPLGTVPTVGWINLPLRLPAGFPRGAVPMQALIGMHLTNLDVVEVR